MDQEKDLRINASDAAEIGGPAFSPPLSRRKLLQYGVSGLACASCGGAVVYYFTTRVQAATASEVFKNDAPRGRLWQQWQDRGWVKEASHYLKLGENIQCKLCPNECLLEPEDRGRCRNRVHKDGRLYTLAYGNPCTFHVDPIEKKPLFHFLPDTSIFSIAATGCGFRCLNCQNWDISQRKPEEMKDPRGVSLRIDAGSMGTLNRGDIERRSMFPEDVVNLTQHLACPSIAYTYSEPTAWFEYMIATAEAARTAKLKNVVVTCGYIQQEPLVELCRTVDAFHVDLKGFDEETYARLNSGKLAPILATIETLRQQRVWFEVINLIVPTYTDKPDEIGRMCRWLLDHAGPDCPLHFSRFHPAHQLTNLPPTPVDILLEAREIARQCGLHYVYIGNVRDVEDSDTTFCPGCKRPVIQRDLMAVTAMDVAGGKCNACGRKIAGVWS
jgi:pyruvate formate lyase activating enzyme